MKIKIWWQSHWCSFLYSSKRQSMCWIYSIIWLLVVCECWGYTPSPLPVLHGEVQSPLYPQPYPPLLSKEWDLTVPEGYRIQLTFTHLDVEPSANCYYDSLTVVYKNKVLGKFCGQENFADGHHPGYEPVLSPGNHLHLAFQSDDSNPGLHRHIGFSAFYQAIDVDECSLPDPEDGSEPLCSQICHNTLGSYLCSCHHGYELRPDQRTCVLQCEGGLYNELEGILSSPGYPLPSPNGMSCQYNVTVEKGFFVTLNFTGNFHVERIEDHEPACLYHWLEVSIPGKKPQKLCGDQSPGVIHTRSHTVKLDYHTDWEGLSHGWRVHYSTERVQCDLPRAIANGKITPIFTKYFYRDYIQVRCHTGYKMMMEGREIKSYFSMCQSSGNWHLPPPECQIIDCGEPSPLLNGGLTFLSGSQNQYLSVIQYHCNEPYYALPGGSHVNYTCGAERNWIDHHGNYIIPTCDPVCGRPTVVIMGLQRVLGGSDAPERTIPWQVLLITSGRGGAAVIGDQWILTAAHNVVPMSSREPVSLNSVQVYVGSNNVDNLLKSPPLGIASIHPHPDYFNPEHRENFNHDIALIKLKEPLTFNATVMPVCLPPQDAEYTSNKMGLVSGFGKDERNYISSKLKYIQLPLVDQTRCNNSINKAKIESSIISSLTDNMFCAGFPEGGKDTCQGDSGGSFTLHEGDRFWAAGIVSWGVKCGMKESYGMYTRVGKYLDWIKMTMQGN